MTFRLKASGVCIALLIAACGGQSEPPPFATKQHAASRVVQSAQDPYAQILQRLYVGYFGRPADAEGLTFYAAHLRAMKAPTSFAEFRASYYTNADIKLLIDGFSSSRESQDLYPGESGYFIDAVYINAFGREADPEGRAYWIDRLDRREITRANAVLEMLAGAQGTDSVLIDLKTQMASEFTAGLNTPERVRAYQGDASSYLGRAMLTSAFPLANIFILRPKVQETLEELDQAYAVGQKPYEEVAAAERRVALLASASQMKANGEKLRRLADALASDLSTRDSGYGPVWKVEVLTAGATVLTTREKLRGFHGTILIGDVPIARHANYYPGGEPLASIDPYRLPLCPLFQFEADGNTLTVPPELYESHPACRTGQFVALLHGRSPQTDISEVAAKLEQMITYHRASTATNSQWSRAYRFISALWAGGRISSEDLSDVWDQVGLYSSTQHSYLSTGTALQRKSAFFDCIASTAEACVLNAHGSPNAVVPEGPGTIGEFYSPDIDTLDIGEIQPLSVGAKYISLVSCSTQDLRVQNNLGTALLMSGRSLLTHGMHTNVLISSEYERLRLVRNYAPLALGATYADAFADDHAGSPEIVQGDPFITMRPTPIGNWPKLAIDGKRYHGANAVVNIEFPDTDTIAKVRRTVVLTNRGQETLRVRPATSVTAIGPDINGQDGMTAQSGGVSIDFDAPIRIRPGGAGSSMMVDEFVLKPGESLPLTFSLQPHTNLPVKVGGYQGRIILITNDPAAPRTILELHGNVRGAL